MVRAPAMKTRARLPSYVYRTHLDRVACNAKRGSSSSVGYLICMASLYMWGGGSRDILSEPLETGVL